MKKLWSLSILVHVSFLCAAQIDYAFRENNTCADEPITIFSHGVGADNKQADFYRSLFCSTNYVTFNYPDAPEKLFNRNHNTGLAQSSEMLTLDRVMDRACNYSQPVILYGLSRGASVIVNVVGYKVADKHKLPNIKAIVLESPFAHSEDIVQGYAKQFKIPPFFMRFLIKRFFKEYDKKRNAPIDWVSYIPQDIPVLFICTTQDTIVPVESTRKLYKKLKESGHKKVHILEVPEGIHANIVWGMYGREYHTVLQAFYRAYDLPHDPAIADLGQERFEQCSL